MEVFDMTALTKTSGNMNAAAPETRARLAAVRSWLADRIPTVIIIGLIALYYIQLSHMG